MNRTSRIIIAVLMLVMVISLLTARSSLFYEPPKPPAVAPVTLSLWCLSEDVYEPMLEYFSASHVSVYGSIPLAITMFDSEADLAAALDEERPDMLLCSASRAVGMDADGKLTAPGFTSPEVFYPSARAVSDCIGKTFFPFGTITDVLAVDWDRYEASLTCSVSSPDAFLRFSDFADLADAYAINGEGVFYTADSFANLFWSALHTEDLDFAAELSSDVASPEFRKLYNRMAENALEHALVSFPSDSIQLLSEQKTLCAILSSFDAVSLEEGRFFFRPVPAWSNSTPVLSGMMDGLAVTCEQPANLPFILTFITDLFREPELIHSYAVSSGYVPSIPGTDAPAPDSLAETLDAIASGARLCLPDIHSRFFVTRYDFEAEFRKNLMILN